MVRRQDFALTPDMSANFVVLSYRNPDGTTGTSADGAAIRLSGNPEFPQISWSGLHAFRLFVDFSGTTRIDYGVEPIDNTPGRYLNPPVTYGDYSIDGFQRYIDASVSIWAIYHNARYVITLYCVEGRATLEFEVR
jgi:hypothetical protein